MSRRPQATASTPLLPRAANAAAQDARPLTARLWEVSCNYLPLAFITFGGPPAHIAILHDMFVVRKRWMSEEMFSELLGISSALPGPASTQLAYTVALARDGLIPAIWAFLIWSVPGAIVMAAFGVLIGGGSGGGGSGKTELPMAVLYLQNGLASTAVALVALAAMNLSNKICTNRLMKCVTVFAAAAAINFPTVPWLIPALMVFGGMCSYAAYAREVRNSSRPATAATSPLLSSQPPQASQSDVQIQVDETGRPLDLHDETEDQDPPINFSYSIRTGLLIIAAWLALFIGAVLIRTLFADRYVQVLGTFFYVGSIIFGGGPVVIPLLYNYIVTPGWATSGDFLLGLAIINALPGPNFNFAAFCGALSLRHLGVGPSILGAILAWIGIFTPGLLVKTGVLPLWRHFRGFPHIQILFRGINAAAVGLVYTATYLLWQKAISVADGGMKLGPLPVGDSPYYVAVVAFAFVGVGFLKVPAPVMIVAGGVAGLLDWLVSAS
ncbi:hypothetical protein HDU87_004072 [Geranomyces variabilis]|uniref:Chromate transporter n=1 Tax=Geranomyces variabilis TaxID=109894 RepID=A0AAD5TR44_9FUNG|nr:hypothetical protein HDU87_004072 [Geranomyces variabilis]